MGLISEMGQKIIEKQKEKTIAIVPTVTSPLSIWSFPVLIPTFFYDDLKFWECPEGGKGNNRTIEEGRRKKEEGRRKKEEGRRKKEEGRRKKEEGRRKKEERGRKKEGRKKEEGRRKKEEGRRKKEEGRRKKEEGRRKKEEGRRKKEGRRRRKKEAIKSMVWAMNNVNHRRGCYICAKGAITPSGILQLRHAIALQQVDKTR